MNKAPPPIQGFTTVGLILILLLTLAVVSWSDKAYRAVFFVLLLLMLLLVTINYKQVQAIMIRR